MPPASSLNIKYQVIGLTLQNHREEGNKMAANNISIAEELLSAIN